MPDTEPTAELNPDFSSPDATPPPWKDVVEVLTTSEMFLLSTVRRDGRPHVTPLPAIWFDGALHVVTGAEEQKAVNLVRDPRCVLATGTPALNAGLDVVVEGVVRRVTDHLRLLELAALWRSKLDWNFAVGEDGFRDPQGRTGLVFAVEPDKVLAFGKGEPFSQTRYRFPG